MRATPPIGMALLSETPAVQPPRTSLQRWLGWGTVLALLAGSWSGADVRPLDLVRDSGNMATYAADFFPPKFTDWRLYLTEMVITLQIALWGTALAVVFAVPMGLLSSANITPAWIHQPVRRLMDAARAINDMVFAMLFIVAVGLGPFAGVLALFVHTTGANALEEIVYGIIPQVLPLWISYSLYRFESNVRSASVVGMVGAGGIGVILWEIIRGFQYAETCAVMIIIIVTVTVIDVESARIRKSLI